MHPNATIYKLCSKLYIVPNDLVTTSLTATFQVLYEAVVTPGYIGVTPGFSVLQITEEARQELYTVLIDERTIYIEL